MTTLLKIAGESGFDFTPFLMDAGYSIIEREHIENKRTPQSSGYDKRTLAPNRKTEIEARFAADISNSDMSSILAALDVAENISLEYWSKRYNRLMLGSFEIAKNPVGTIANLSDRIINDEWKITLKIRGEATALEPTTVTKYAGTITDKAGSWSDEDNMKAANSLYCTNVGVTNVNQKIAASNFGFEIPETAEILSVTKEVCYKVSTQASAITLYMESAYKGSYRGIGVMTHNEPLTDEIISSANCGTWTPAQLNSIYAEIWLGYKRTSSTACTISVNWVRFTVVYKEVG
ncbi:MAG: hypothetical protein WC374_11750 [Phycisphaerae bacterium]|jgi:hypothetical protein